MCFGPERHVCDTELQLECTIYGHAPVQADGKLAGHPLYFRARWDHWTFTLCTNADIDASFIGSTTESGFFQDGDYTGFELGEDYGSGSDASYMSYTDAERLIRECAARYLAETSPKPPA